MNSVKYDREGRVQRRREFLKSIPEPDDVFIAAAKDAAASVGLQDRIEKNNHTVESDPYMPI